jgi:hypothetical protein
VPHVLLQVFSTVLVILTFICMIIGSEDEVIFAKTSVEPGIKLGSNFVLEQSQLAITAIESQAKADVPL